MKVVNYKVDDSTQKMDKVVFMEHIKTVFQPKFNQFLENITDKFYEISQGGAKDNLKVVNELDHGINEVNEENDYEEPEVSRSSIEEESDVNDYESEEVSTEEKSEVGDTYVEESLENMEVTRSPEENQEVKRINQRILIINEKSRKLSAKIMKQRIEDMDDYDVRKEMKDMIDKMEEYKEIERNMEQVRVDSAGLDVKIQDLRGMRLEVTN